VNAIPASFKKLLSRDAKALVGLREAGSTLVNDSQIWAYPEVDNTNALVLDSSLTRQSK